VSYFFNITAYTADNAEASLATEQEILNSYRKGGFELLPARYHHLRNYLAMLPFKSGEGCSKSCRQQASSSGQKPLMWLICCRLLPTVR
jgi:type IV secretory pathway VirB4 component